MSLQKKIYTTVQEVRLHSAIGYVTPHDMLAGRQAEIQQSRDAKLEAARVNRAEARRQQRTEAKSDARSAKSSVPLLARYNDDIRSEDKALLESKLSAAPMLLGSGGGELRPVTAALLLANSPNGQSPGGMGAGPHESPQQAFGPT